MSASVLITGSVRCAVFPSSAPGASLRRTCSGRSPWTQAVVPQMLERGTGRILILSSVAGVAAGR
jgi:hypothetical protein